MVDLGTLGGDNSYGRAINDKGQVTGFSEISGGYDRAFIYSDGRMSDLGTLGGPWLCCSVGNGINDAGQVVEFSYRYPIESPPHAFFQ